MSKPGRLWPVGRQQPLWMDTFGREVWCFFAVSAWHLQPCGDELSGHAPLPCLTWPRPAWAILAYLRSWWLHAPSYASQGSFQAPGTELPLRHGVIHAPRGRGASLLVVQRVAVYITLVPRVARLFIRRERNHIHNKFIRPATSPFATSRNKFFFLRPALPYSTYK